MDLHPELALGGAAAGDDFLHAVAVAAQGLEDVLGAVGDTFDHGAEEVAGAVAQREAKDDAAGFGVDVGGAVALEVVDDDRAPPSRAESAAAISLSTV